MELTLFDRCKPPLVPNILRLTGTKVTSQNEKTTLLGKTKQDYAAILRWLSFVNAEVLPKLGAWYRPLLGLDPYNKKNVEDAVKAANKALAVLEKHLTANTYLVGERITLADYFGASLLTRAFATVLDKAWRSENVAVTRWYNTIINQAPFKAVVPSPVFAEEAIKYTPPKKEEKPKAAPAPAKAAAPAAEPEAQPEKKPKHPLEALGKPEFVLDEWKRQYSNEDTRPVALPWFWQNYKPEEYSLYAVDYKYNNELKLTFMANNLIGKILLLWLGLTPPSDFSPKVVSTPVLRLPASTSSVLSPFTARTTTALSAVSSLSVVRIGSPPLRSPLTGRATTSASSTPPTPRTRSSSRTCGPGTPPSLSMARSTPTLMVTSSNRWCSGNAINNLMMSSLPLMTLG